VGVTGLLSEIYHCYIEVRTAIYFLLFPLSPMLNFFFFEENGFHPIAPLGAMKLCF
jgi:hypothetical protein